MVLSARYETVIDILRNGEMYGDDIIDKSNGILGRVPHLTLMAMEAEGLIEGHGPCPRRLYQVTDSGLHTFFRRHSRLPDATLVSV